MSWLDKIQNNFTITTGDGKVYTPNWISATKDLEWNVSEFDFPSIDGTLVSKKKKRGNRYNTELYFQGETHLDTATAFEQSATISNRAWTISHPLYGQINIQMPSIRMDNTQMNVTKISGVMIETILEDFPKPVADPVQEIINQKAVTDELQAVSMDSTPIASDSRLATQQNETAYREGFKIVPDQVSGEEFFNLYNEALASILNITADPITTMRKMQAVINKPAQFEVSVKNRIDTFVDLFNSNRRNLDKLTEPSSKKIFQIVCGAIVSAMCTSSAQPQVGNYTNKQSVFTIINQIVSTYNQYIADLDTLQSANNSNSSSFIPDWTSQVALNKLVNYTISTLFTIALGAKQERAYICEQDTNVILLTHRFLGLDKNDTNINTMIEINNIGLNEMLNIKKGREIIYYV